MKKKRLIINKHNSIFRRVFFPMSILVVFIICFFIGIVYYYDILGQLDENNESIFNQQVVNRTEYLENLMLSKWSSIDEDVKDIQSKVTKLIEDKDISINEIMKSSQDTNYLLNELSPDIIHLLRNHGTTGAYLFFEDGSFDVSSAPGMYITDDDPTSSYEESNSDLLLERSPIEMLGELRIPTNHTWQPLFEFAETERIDYKKVYENFNLSIQNPDLSFKDLGRWLRPYKVHGSERTAISYILPLVYEEKVFGIVGIDISFDYLETILPHSTLNTNNDGAYVLALKQDSNQYIPLFINKDSSFSSKLLEDKLIDDNLKDIYYNGKDLKLYNTNTPYENEQWALLGVIEEDNLYAFSNHLQEVFVIGFILIFIVGTVLSFALSHYISDPIISLSKSIAKTKNVISKMNLKRTHISEIDQLIQAIEKMGNDSINSASRFTNIIELANTKLAGFEINYEDNSLFITDKFFDIFMLHDIDTKKLTVESFSRILKSFDSSCISATNMNEYLYHIEANQENIYLRLRFHLDDKRCVGLIEEVTDTVKQRQVIEHERDHDILTSLMNRRAYQTNMKRLFSIDSSKLNIAALVMLDLDNLKKINDKYGHDCGDVYIAGIAKIFIDTVPKDTLVSRASGDEFFLFFYGYQTREEIEAQITLLKQALNQAYITLPNNHEVKVSASGGVSWYPDDSNNFEELQRYADYAMYSVKHTEKGRIESFDIADYENDTFVMKKRMDFQQLVEEKNYTFHFQPIIDAKTGHIFGYEALLRSLHPSFKGPMDIISIAKLEGQLSRIEILTWEGATKMFCDFYKNDMVDKNTKVFINSVSSQYMPDDIIKKIEVESAPIMDKIVLEVTEDEENDINVYQSKLTHLKRWKAQVALDDYGTGYNNERNLLNVNPDYVKIDIGIIRDINKDMDKQKLVDNIVSYCHERGKFVIAEGVETLDELASVLRLNVDYIQGYLFAKPTATPSQINEDARLALIEYNNQTTLY